ncbi:PRC-barrel domain-containing protein [Jiella mangrovi]|nr:PRC-barrel domain-containing protein [Jiella mangrovi]
MRKATIIALFASVALPLSAYAQDSGSTAPTDGSTPPAASDSTDTGSSTPDAANSGDSGTSTDSGTMDSGASSGSSDAGSADSMESDSADSTAPADTSSSQTADSGPFVTMPPSGAWRASDLEGKDVYDTQGESIGEITDVLVSEDGKLMAVLVGVGGFLGIGEKDVAVSMSALEFGPGKTEGLKTEEEANAAASAAAGSGGTGMAGGTGTAGGTTGGTGMAGGTAGGEAAPAPEATAEPQEPVVGEDNLPDRIVLNVSREQLEQAPAYGEPESEGEDSESGEASTDPASGDASQPASGDTAPAN